MNDLSPCGADFRELHSIGPVPSPIAPTSPPIDPIEAGAGTTWAGAEALPGAATSEGGIGGVVVPVEESTLPKKMMEAYRLRLAGEGMSEVAAKFGVDRTTIWRWVQRVETEAADQLANEPVFNIIAREIARLTDLEAQSRSAALNCPDESKSKIGHLDQARRCCMARTSLMLRIGLIPSLPEKLFAVIGDYRPAVASTIQADDGRGRDEAIRLLIEAMRRARTIG